jgi:hypothetical protein
VELVRAETYLAKTSRAPRATASAIFHGRNFFRMAWERAHGGRAVQFFPTAWPLETTSADHAPDRGERAATRSADRAR